MKRILICLTFLFVSYGAISQNNAKVLFLSGDTKELKIIAVSENQLFTDNGTFELKNINEVSFLDVNKSPAKSFVDNLKAAGIKIVWGDQILSEVTSSVTIDSSLVMKKNQSNTLNNNSVYEAELTQLYRSLRKFEEQQFPAKTLQLIGVVSIGTGLFLAYEKPNTPTSVLKALSIGGAGLAAIGFIVDINASKHLRLKIR